VFIFVDVVVNDRVDDVNESNVTRLSFKLHRHTHRHTDRQTEKHVDHTLSVTSDRQRDRHTVRHVSHIFTGSARRTF